MNGISCIDCKSAPRDGAVIGDPCAACGDGIYLAEGAPGSKWPDVYIAGELLEWSQVTWDRFTEDPSGEITVYGWMPRADARSDFVVIVFQPEFHQESFPRVMTTSSPEFSAAWAAKTESGHNDCQRVEARFPQVGNAVRLAGDSPSAQPHSR